MTENSWRRVTYALVGLIAFLLAVIMFFVARGCG